MFSCEFIAKSLGIKSPGGAGFTRIWTDTRSLQKGDLFGAISGLKFDGHDYVFKAFEAGAKGAIVSQANFNQRAQLPSDFQIFEVPNVTEALRQIAQAYRQSLKTQIFAVAGSNGKTTTKELLYYLLKEHFSPEGVFKTEKSNNSILGIALSLLQIRPQHRYAVIEIGIDEPGWMEKHLEVVRPNGGLITIIGEEHLNALKTIEVVAEEELKLLHFLRESHGIFAANWDSSWIRGVTLPSKSLTYSLESNAQIEGVYQPPDTLNAFGLEFRLPLPGRHNAQNLLAALSALRLIDPEISQGEMDRLRSTLPYFKGEAHRGLWLEFEKDIRVYDDCYNANPESMEKALQAFVELSDGCRQKLILGDMLDLGEATDRSHSLVLNRALVSGVDEIYLFGPHFKKALSAVPKSLIPASIKVEAIDDMQKLKSELKERLIYGDCLFLKGSRGMALERFLEIFETPSQ